jgi:hypothetical protein
MTAERPADVPAELLLDLQTLIGQYQPSSAMIPTARQTGSTVSVEIIGGDVRALGLILATLTSQFELDDPESLSRRITLGPSRRSWVYGIVAGRYLTPDRGIVLKVTIEMPAEDVPEVVARLTADTP